ncbi:MAG: hypothetical protein AB1571_04255 [Nanoarchaeota archaeon]
MKKQQRRSAKLDRANIFYSALAVVVVVLVGIFSYTFLANIEKSNKMIAGSSSLELIHSYETAEKAKFYIHESAKIAAWQSIEEISQNLNDFDSKFLDMFNKNLNSNLKSYQEISLLQDNYNYIIDTTGKLKVIGKAKQQIEPTKSNNLSIKYSFEPNFEVEIPYNIDYYLTLTKDLSSCIKDIVDEQCLNSLKEKNDFNYKTDDLNKNLINFEISAGTNVYTNKLITIKFNKKINPLLS